MKSENHQNQILFFSPYWGYDECPLVEFIPKIKLAGYDGMEINIVSMGRDEVFSLLELAGRHDLKIITQVAGIFESDFEKYKERFLKNLDFQMSLKPLFINCHTGSDFFSLEQNMELVEAAGERANKSGVKIVHETHRGRFNYSPAQTLKLLELNADLRLTADFSHWCVVSESLLENHQTALKLAISRSDHIHSRIGYAQGPQVPDPRLPEWKTELNAHLSWWDEIVKHHWESKDLLTVTTEFGPPDYMQTIPFTRLPVASQWEINLFMKDLLKERYTNAG